jgi:hypothetical protein
VQSITRKHEAPGGDRKIFQALHLFWFTVLPNSGRSIFLQGLHMDMNCVFCHAFAEDRRSFDFPD